MAIRGLSPLMLPPPTLSARALTKLFARGLARSPHRATASESVDIDVYPGEIVALVGGPGGGKTTLLQCLGGLLRPDSGRIELFGEGFATGWTPPGVAYVAAVPVFYPFLTPLDAIELAAARNPEGRSTSRTAEDLAELLDIATVRSARISSLPRDILRRVSIAQALAIEPSVVLVDSSASDLVAPFDPVSVRALVSCAEKGAAVVLAARELSTVAFVATRLFMMKNGRTARTFTIESFGEPVVAGIPAIAPRIVAERVH